MIVIPSPELLIHRKSQYYDRHVFKHEVIKESNAYFAQLAIDSVMKRYKQFDTFSKLSRMNKTIFASEFVTLPTSKIALLLGAISANMGNYESAIYWYKNAAMRGSDRALLALGILYRRNCIIHQQQTQLQHFQEKQQKEQLTQQQQLHALLSMRQKIHMDNDPIRWFIRAFRRGSIESMQHIGLVFASLNDNERAIHYIFKHYNQTDSIFSKLTLAELLRGFGKPEKAVCYYMSAACQGYLPEITDILKCPDCSFRNYWMNLKTKFQLSEFEPKKNYNFKKYFDTQLETDSVYPDLAQLSDAFWSFDSIKNTEENISQDILFNSCDNSAVDLNDNYFYVVGEDFRSKESRILFQENNGFYPLEYQNKTRVLIQALKYASADFKKRDLQIAARVLRKGGINSSNLYSHFFKSLKKSKNPEKLIPCGLIALLLDQDEQAKKILLRAARKGSEEASLLYGLLLFHSTNEEDIEDGSFHLARCMANPIALMHIGIANNDTIYLGRAADILGITEYHQMFEMLGDLFCNGVKLVKNHKIAYMWYGVTIHYLEIAGESTAHIIKKIKSFSLF